MYIAFIVEDSSTEALLKHILPSILTTDIDYTIHSHKGLGHIPNFNDIQRPQSMQSDMLLQNLPKLLRGFKNSSYIDGVIILCDTDERDAVSFLSELNDFVRSISPDPIKNLICLAIEETEAWYFGDLIALKRAYPRANQKIIDNYSQDTACQTWEKLVDAIVEKRKVQETKKFPLSGHFKHQCAENIGKYMNVEENRSPSFQSFRDSVREFIKRT